MCFLIKLLQLHALCSVDSVEKDGNLMKNNKQVEVVTYFRNHPRIRPEKLKFLSLFNDSVSSTYV